MKPRVAIGAAAVVLLALEMTGCSSSHGIKRKGAYYQDDGPHAHLPANLDDVPDATPRIEPFSKTANRPYVALGKSYAPDLSGKPYKARGLASWYGKKYHGKLTSCGERYDMYAMTAAHPTLPLPSYVRVTRLLNGRSVVVRVNDRGPFHSDRLIDLSYVAAYKLGIVESGSAEVWVESISFNDIRNWKTQNGGSAAFVHSAAAIPVAPPSASWPTTSVQTLPEVNIELNKVVYLQLGAFSENANAHALMTRINNGLNADNRLRASIEEISGLYRVKLGPYADRQKALQAIEQVFESTGVMPSIASP